MKRSCNSRLLNTSSGSFYGYLTWGKCKCRQLVGGGHLQNLQTVADQTLAALIKNLENNIYITVILYNNRLGNMCFCLSTHFTWCRRLFVSMAEQGDRTKGGEGRQTCTAYFTHVHSMYSICTQKTFTHITATCALTTIVLKQADGRIVGKRWDKQTDERNITLCNKICFYV